ncbi:MAG: alkaline phosphatase family protein [Phycisphaerae bacterium]
MNVSLRCTLCRALALFLIGTLAYGGGCREDKSGGTQFIVLGFDGMDPVLCEKMMDAGQLPTLAAMRDRGGFRPLGTSTPPQSPVAWSSLITGTDPGKHGIFDFVHRNPKTYIPYASTSETKKSDPWYGFFLPESLPWGEHHIPLIGSEVINLRHGKPFWEYLTEGGIPTQVYRMPANYPPTPSAGAPFACLSDMGTPDIRGTNGEFSFYTDDLFPKKIGGGGDAYSVTFINDVAVTAFIGPPDDTLRQPDDHGPSKRSEMPLTIYRDPSEATIRLLWADQQVVLAQGQWSQWYPVEFEMGPQWPAVGVPVLPSAKAICRFYLKEVRPRFQLYVTPLNIDPLDPSLPVSQPNDFVTDVAEQIGRHYTQGLPEDTKALSHGVLNRDEFLQQAGIVFDERVKMFDYALDHFNDGMMFFYFGSTDQVGHMFWGAQDPNHPALTDEEHVKYAHVIEKIYVQADAMIAKALKRFPEATLLVLSDHGFDTFTRQFNLNNWLMENGYAVMRNPSAPGTPVNFDFSKTQAYAMGINGLYINVQGREGRGIVPPSQKDALTREIIDKLKAYKDAQTDKNVVKEVYRSQDVYSPEKRGIGPDMQVGYHRSFRASWTAALGGFDAEIMSDNTDAWCADHCIATDLVPGVLFSNKPLLLEQPDLEDIAPTVFSAFGLDVPQQMTGHNVLTAGTSVVSAP